MLYNEVKPEDIYTTGGKPLLRDCKFYQDKYLPILKEIFGTCSIKAKTTVAQSKETEFTKIIKTNKLFRWKLELNQMSVQVDTFLDLLKQLEARTEFNVYEIDFTVDLSGCTDYEQMRDYLTSKGKNVQISRTVGNNMVQWIENNHRCKFYDKIVYNIECKNQNETFGTNFCLNIDNI